MSDELEFEWPDLKLFKAAKPGDKFELKYYNCARKFCCIEAEFIDYNPRVGMVTFKHPYEPGKTFSCYWDNFLSVKKLS